MPLIDNVRRSLSKKVFLFIIIAASIPTLVLGFLNIRQTSNLLRESALVEQSDDVDGASDAVVRFFSGLQSDVVFLANSSPITQLNSVIGNRNSQQLLDAIESDSDPALTQARALVAQEMQAKMLASDVYFKLRYIDASGQEIVEVSQTDGVFTVSPFDKLADEGGDDYVVEGVKLPAGEVFAGRFKLETQGGVIVEPNIPALRFSTPIIDNGTVYGVIVGNIDLDKLIEPELRSQGYYVADLDQEGMYLSNVDSSKEFGIDLETGISLLAEMPFLQDSFANQSTDSIELTDGRFLTYQVVNPIPGREWAVFEFAESSEVLAPVRGFLTTFAIILIGLFMVVAAIATWLSRQITGQTTEINRVFSQVKQGDYAARAEVLEQDELGDIAFNMNETLDVIGGLIQTEEEKNNIQRSIFTLLEEVANAADGDLTVEATVDDEVTGAIADSFNFMITQLRTIINDVQDATLQVSSSANEVQTTAEHLTLGSESQASQILDTSAAIDEMTVSIQQVSENAALSATVGEQARANAEKGAEAVRNTIDGMERIRGQVQDTSKRIRRLGDSSQRIGEIVDLIDDIADRTSILALNASIQAELAGDAGRSFAVVAEEVESLAERSTQATQQISILIRNIQSEINEAIAAMESTTDETVAGAEIANEAGQRLQEIETVSDRLSELINSISLAAKQQARGSETIARSMTEIADVTQQTAAGTREATSSIGNLAVLADELRSSVSTFKLPDNDEFVESALEIQSG